MRKHEQHVAGLVPEAFRERRALWASAGVSLRRQALYRRVGEFGAGMGERQARLSRPAESR